MSDRLARGWDRPSDETTERHLCSHHRATTRHLSTFHANQLAVACPWCADPSKREPLWHNGIGGYPTSKPSHSAV